MAATVLNTKVSEAKGKIPDTSSLVTTTVLNVKIREFQTKFMIMLNILQLKNAISQLEKILKI